MKKYLCLLILVLMLGACNMPINPTPTADLVSTAVSGTLTSAPTNTIAVPTETQPPVPPKLLPPLRRKRLRLHQPSQIRRMLKTLPSA